eukprot:TRINITY_DN87821_c0_g1_i1.p1 TRINITY_DN87821_c0_g1~~TRINITY_DN87821_c0_g1_i1.p1  ORF type:complete len:169 (+),score=26.24 TRINITY_DN87821_c0_g1_i1:44-508(+)
MAPSKTACFMAAAGAVVLIPGAFVPVQPAGSSPPERVQWLPSGEVDAPQTPTNSQSAVATFVAAAIVGLLAGLVCSPRMALAQAYDASNYMDIPSSWVPSKARQVALERAAQGEQVARVKKVKESLEKCKICIRSEGSEASSCKQCAAYEPLQF